MNHSSFFFVNFGGGYYDPLLQTRIKNNINAF